MERGAVLFGFICSGHVKIMVVLHTKIRYTPTLTLTSTCFKIILRTMEKTIMLDHWRNPRPGFIGVSCILFY